MVVPYCPQEIEQQAQQYWQKKQSFSVTEDLNTEKFYCLSMLPYPSGTLHMGHVRNYTIGDVIARYQRAQGKNVLQPIGWDAFGLPAENAAHKHHLQPADWTQKNIHTMKKQLMRLGFAYDWTRELSTCDPSYYRWEQWLFLRLYQKGLAYKKNAVVNWDPVDQTVLANEQVIDGRGWRSGAPIERKEISQWFLKITDYAKELHEKLDHLPQWPAQVKEMQRNWIGQSHGCYVYFDLTSSPAERLTVFTTRPETLMGVTYLAIAPDHPLAVRLGRDNAAIQAFIDECRHVKLSEAEIATLPKKGIDTQLEAHHPLTQQILPVWIANFVLMQYGEGAVMSVPAHDKRDWEFAKRYHLPLQPVIQSELPHDYSHGPYTGEGHLINSEPFEGLSTLQASPAIIQHLTEKQHGKAVTHYRLRDWGISRQRYWGTPIPMILCSHCGIVPVPEQDLPVMLPTTISFEQAGNPLDHAHEFLAVPCPTCQRPAKRETDTFDTFMESSWYYARYTCKQQDNTMLDERANYWTPVDQYIGGIEHACMHLLYARFIHKILRDEGLINSDEPFQALLTQGMVLKDGSKMSKSLGNTVDPTHLVQTYGADTARLFVMFAAPPEQSLEWSDAGVEGTHRFLKRLWTFAHTHAPILIKINALSTYTPPDWSQSSPLLQKMRHQLHMLLQQINHDYKRLQFNTVVSGCMKLLNLLTEYPLQHEEDECFLHQGVSILLPLLAPMTPHICHYLWNHLGFEKAIIDAHWPRVDKLALKTDQVDYIIQVNGKRRGQFHASSHLEEAALLEQAYTIVQTFLSDKTILKRIVVAHRHLINFVTQP